jgi:hypothetical protein
MISIVLVMRNHNYPAGKREEVFMTNITNIPSLAGQQAGTKQFFGEYRRYAVYPVHTRFDAVSWFVADAMNLDEVTGFASIIRQADTKEAAIAGLLTDDDVEVSGVSFIPKMNAGLTEVADGFERLNQRLVEIAAG